MEDPRGAKPAGETLTRLWEVDLLRGCALLMMAAFHVAFDLWFLGDSEVEPYSGLPAVLGYGSAILFVGLVGVSLSLSAAKRGLYGDGRDGRGADPDAVVAQAGTGWAPLEHYLKRGAGIFAIGMGISLVTYLLLPDYYVRFGVLHLIGISIILAYPLIRRGWSCLLLGAIMVVVGLYLRWVTTGVQWLFWLGLRPHVFVTLDYFPILPWLGVVLLGTFLGHQLFPGGSRRFWLPDLSHTLFVRVMTSLGRHTLVVYLVHQPVIIMLLWGMGLVDLPLP